MLFQNKKTKTAFRKTGGFFVRFFTYSQKKHFGYDSQPERSRRLPHQKKGFDFAQPDTYTQ